MVGCTSGLLLALPLLPVHIDTPAELTKWSMGIVRVLGAASAWMTTEQDRAVVSPLTALPVPLSRVRNPPHRAYDNDDVLALVDANPIGDETPETAAS